MDVLRLVLVVLAAAYTPHLNESYSLLQFMNTLLCLIIHDATVSSMILTFLSCLLLTNHKHFKVLDNK